jgi:regulator of sigma E protease
VMNYLLAFVLFFLVVAIRGMPEPSKDPVIGDIAPGYPAATAGIEVNDRIVKINGTAVDSWLQAAQVIHGKPNESIKLTLQRGEKQVDVSVMSKLDTASGQGLIGIMPKTDYHNIGIAGAAKEGLRQCWLWTRLTVTTLAQKIYHHEKPDVAGPVGIIQMVSRAAHSGLDDLVFLIGLISVAVGFFNILPVPLLDGGHAALYLWEGISRKKLTLRMVNAVNSVGMVFLMSLLLFATYNDLMRIRDEHRAQKMAHSAPAQPQ